MQHPANAQGLARRAFLSLATALCLLPSLAPAADAIPVSRAGNPRRTPIVEVVEKVKDAVVNIHSERTVAAAAGGDDLYGLGAAPSRVNGMGTGIILDPRGYIVTNQHVVDDVQVLRVRLNDGSSYPARVVARDQNMNVTADFLRCGDGVERRALERSAVVLGDDENGHAMVAGVSPVLRPAQDERVLWFRSC